MFRHSLKAASLSLVDVSHHHCGEVFVCFLCVEDNKVFCDSWLDCALPSMMPSGIYSFLCKLHLLCHHICDATARYLYNLPTLSYCDEKFPIQVNVL